MSDEPADAMPSAPLGLPRRTAWLMLFMFFLSGVAALVYQIVWARQLYLVFGVTIYATSAVVTAFMAGLALGSLYFGRWVDRWKSPLLLFGFLQLGIAIFGLCFPLIRAALEPLYVAFYGPFGDNHYVMSLVRFVLSFMVLLVPTSLMGGTLPVLSRAYVSHAKRLGREVAGLYSVNNLGAFIGCVLAGYALLELLGLRGTLFLAVSLNLAVAAVSLFLAARLGRQEAPQGPEPVVQEAEIRENEPLPRAVKVALWVFGIEGFTSLAYQMAWLRMLIFFIQTNIYAITAIVATFLAGLSLGAFVVKRWVDRTGDPYRMLGVIEVGIGVTTLVTIPLLPWMFRFYGGFQRELWRLGWAGSAAACFAIAFFVILVPTTFMGATMPVVSRIYLPALRRLGRKMGVIGCLDTVGSIFGAFAGGFILIPLLGIQRTIIATALINLALAAWVLWADPVPRRKLLTRSVFLISVAALLTAPLLLLLKPMPLINASGSPEHIGQRRILYYQEDAESTVSVVKAYEFARMLFVNHVVAAQTDRFDRPSHELIAHVPLLIHPNPKRVLLIGFGIGFTAWACRVHDVEVDVVELSPGVRRANYLFTDCNNDILSDERVHLRIDDGRNYVLGTRLKYDMVQAGIIHPGNNAGSAGFYTVDFYRECKRILAPGGVMCQWLPLHGMPHEDFKMLIRSFQEQFPYTSIWYKQTPNFCVLIGTAEPLQIDFSDIERRVNRPEVLAHLARSNVQDVYDLLDSFCCAGDELRERLGPGPVHSDNRPYIEFHCGRPFLLFGYPQSVQFLQQARQPVWPRLVNVPPERMSGVKERLERWSRGTRQLSKAQYYAVLLETFPLRPDEYRRMLDEMNTAFRSVLELNPDDKNAEFLWQRAVSLHRLFMARTCMESGRRDEALRHVLGAMEIAPGTYPAAQAKYLYERALLLGAE